MRKKIDEEINETRSLKYFLVLFAIIVLIFGAFMISRLIFKPKVKTLDDLFDESLKKESKDSFVYKGYSFVKIDELWYTRVKKPKTGEIFTIPLHFSPRNLEYVIVSGNVYGFAAWVESLGRVYITFNPEQERLSYVTLANSELSASLIQVIGITPTVACDRFQEGACETVPIINCTNTDEPVIYLKEDKERGVFQKGNCLTIQGEGMELVKAMNRFLYEWYGVMD